MFQGYIYEAKSSPDGVKGYPPVSSSQIFALDSIACLEDISTPITSLNIFDLYLRVALPKSLQEIWWYQDIEYFSRRKDCVFKSVGDVNKSSNNIP